jgi:hypothetical protein
MWKAGLDRRRWGRASLAAALALCTVGSQGQTVEASPVAVSIEVAVLEGARAIATVTYRNVSGHDVWILRDPPNLFLECDGARVADIGPAIKRKPYTLADHERIEPGRAVQRQQEITSQFAWLPGTRRYTLSTGGGYVDPVSKTSFDAPLARAIFEFTR